MTCSTSIAAEYSKSPMTRKRVHISPMDRHLVLQSRWFVTIAAALLTGVATTGLLALFGWTDWQVALVIGGIAGLLMAIVLPFYFYAEYGPASGKRPSRPVPAQSLTPLPVIIVGNLVLVLIVLALGGTDAWFVAALIFLGINSAAAILLRRRSPG